MYIRYRKNIFQCLFVILVISNLVACNLISGSSKKDAQFANMFPDIKLGEYLKLVTVANGEILPETKNDYIGIAIINISDQQIIFPEGFPHQNFIYDDAKEEWIPVPEKLISHGFTMILYPQTDLEKEQFRDWTDVVSPELTGFKKPIVVRILYLGEVIQNGESTGQKVGSYIDITFKP